MASVESVSHLAEAFAVAQLTAADEAQAEAIVEQAYAESTGADRLALLRSVLALSGVTWVREAPLDLTPLMTPSQDVPASDRTAISPWLGDKAQASDQAAEEAAREASSQTPTSNSRIAHEPRPSLVEARIARQKRDRYVLGAFSNLTPQDRVLCFFHSRGLINPGDLAHILQVDSAQGASEHSGASRRFSDAIGGLDTQTPGSSEPLSESWERDSARAEQDLEALGRMLERLTDQPSAELRRRVQGADEGLPPIVAPRRRRSSLGMVSIIILLAVTAGLLIPRLLPQAVAPALPQTNVIEAAATNASGGRIMLETNDHTEATAFLLRRADLNLSVPEVEGFVLAAVGFGRLVDELQAPVLFYSLPEQSPSLFIVVIDYALLERESDRLTLDRPTLDGLARQSAPPNRVIDGHSTIAIRNRDDIYIAVSAELDVDLAGRVSFE